MREEAGAAGAGRCSFSASAFSGTGSEIEAETMGCGTMRIGAETAGGASSGKGRTAVSGFHSSVGAVEKAAGSNPADPPGETE